MPLSTKSQARPECVTARRQFLRSGVYLTAAGLWLPHPSTAQEARPPREVGGDGGNDPFPIPWLDKNGSHNQSPGPEQEPSNIFHFKGRVARCNDFTGMGTDNQGNRIGFGSPSTDFSFMGGEY